jgi:hypothetical protein
MPLPLFYPLKNLESYPRFQFQDWLGTETKLTWGCQQLVSFRSVVFPKKSGMESSFLDQELDNTALNLDLQRNLVT